jgi:hypothetical protein
LHLGYYALCGAAADQLAFELGKAQHVQRQRPYGVIRWKKPVSIRNVLRLVGAQRLRITFHSDGFQQNEMKVNLPSVARPPHFRAVPLSESSHKLSALVQ